MDPSPTAGDDRNKLLNFILSSVEVFLPDGVESIDDLDLDEVSVDDVLQCIRNDVVIDVTHVPVKKSAVPPALPPKRGVTQDSASFGTVPLSAEPTGNDNDDDDDDDDDDDPEGTVLGNALPKLGGGGERELPLERDELVILAYETLLLCTGVIDGNDVETSDQDALRLVRTQLGLGSRSHNRAVQGLQLPDDVTQQAPPGSCWSLGYRLLLVQHRRPSDLDSFDQFKTWHYRQCVFLSHCFKWWLRHAEGLQHYPNTENVFQELIDIVAKFNSTDEFERYCGSSYSEQTAALSTWASPIFDSLSSVSGTQSTDGFKLWYPYPVATELYEVLTEAQFDQVEPGRLLGNKDDVVRLYRHVRKRLCISVVMAQLALVKLSFHVFSESEDKALLDPAMEFLDRITSLPSPDPQNPMPNQAMSKTFDSDYRRVVLMEIVDYAREQLGDYRENYCHDPGKMEGLLSCLPYVWDLAEPNVKHEDDKVLSQSIQASVDANYARVLEQAELERPFDMSEAAQFTNNLVVEVATDLQHFAPVFTEYMGTASSEIVRSYVKNLVDDLSSVFSRCDEMNHHAVDLAKCLGFLEEKLEAAHKDLLHEVYALFMVPVHGWVNGLQQKYITAIRRMVQMEKWVPVTDSPCHSSSVVDMFAMWNQQVPLFFNFKIPGAIQFVNSLAMTIDEVVQSYAMALVKGVGTKETFIPPIPGVSMSKTKFGGLMKKQEEPSFISEADERRLSLQTPQQLMTRLNNLVELPRKLSELKARMESSFEEVRAVRPDAGPPLASLNLFDSSFAVCRKAFDELAEYIGYKLVYFELRHVYLDRLYVPSVAQSRVDRVLDKLDPLLGLIMEMVYPEYTKRVIAQLFKAFLEVYRRVLLDGGKDRIFVAEDHRYFEEDILEIAEFFIVDKDPETGECLGLPDTEVEKWTGTLQTLMMVFEASSEELIEQYKCAPTTDPHNPMVRGNIFRVLVHRRNDRVAKQWVHTEKKRLGLS